MEKLLLTAEEAADVLSLGRTKVFQLIGEGTLRSVRIGKCRRVPAEALREFVEQVAAADCDHQLGRDPVTPRP